jgi:serine/threonine protein kinase, bacterial
MEGKPFGRYRLIELLGRGGMGEVWRAYDTGTDRIVAIKLLPPHFSDNEEFKQRFRREAQAAAKLNTPHVIPIHDYGEIEGRLYVCMRLIEGRDLHTVLADGPLEPSRAVRIIEGVALALHAASEVGLLHRDIKPSNILLDKNDFAYLIDFGIALAADEKRMTKSGYAIGTFAYIAPERLGTRAEEDARADVYSLACVLYECLTGSPPFQPPPSPPTLPATEQAPLPPTEQAHNRVSAQPSTVKADLLATAKRDTPPPTDVPPVQRVLHRPSGRAKIAVIAGAVALGAVIAAFVGVSALGKHGSSGSSPTLSKRPYGAQVVLPFTGLKNPVSVAVDSSGALYVADYRNNRVLKLPAGSTSQQVLPFTGLSLPSGVAVDSAGGLYVTDYDNNRVVKLPAGSSRQAVLPFDLNHPEGVAVDSAGTLYVADTRNNRVLKLAAGSTTRTVLPFTGHPKGVAVDSAGTLYVTDSDTYRNPDSDNNRVLKLAAGSTTPTVLRFTGLKFPHGVAVDAAGTLYVTDDDNNRVLKLAAGSTTPTVLPFTGLNSPTDVAVDSAGTLYVADTRNNRVLKLPAA